MKTAKACPKCHGTDIARIDGGCGAYGAGNNVLLGKTIFSAVKINRYICCDCGYTEEWIDQEDLARIKNTTKARG